ncbi:hypothetical protein A2335_01730 [Candidatus Peregrinibacteria bacterium RIFOXYB2_FULL_32_7]|nr:MAG: hypothetical protein A2335_01730 [Candidatus Peregrinibacteria bacterium RIFOXYB2_FULL_32_7]
MLIEKELKTKVAKDFWKAVLNLKTESECEKFFRDVATLSELMAMCERWQVAKMVDKGISYREINQQTGVSTATITRVAHWLNYGTGGYKLMLEKMKN